jgi:cytochrome b subunit of formate dehydrogenase
LLPLSVLVPGSVHAQFEDGDCLECHGDPELADEEGRSLFVADTLWQASVHGEAGLGCGDCHQGIEDLPHEASLPAVDCGTCHEEEAGLYAQGVHGQAHARGDPDAPDCASCHGTHEIRPPDDPRSLTNKFNLPLTCARCHADPKIVKRHRIPVADPLAAYRKSVHGKTLLVEKNDAAPSCADCHGVHRILPRLDPESPLSKTRVPMTCGQCHEDVAQVFLESVHGVEVEKGNPDAPACNDCHGEHGIQRPSEPTSLVYPKNIVETTCPRCHESLILAQRYGFPPDRVKTYQQTYHGLASRLGGLPVANCASCHGVHNIYPADDPRSTINPANLQKTCGQCHPDATKTFAQIDVHSPATRLPTHPVSKILRNVYIWLIILVIGGMFLHNLLIWLSYVVRKYKREKEGPLFRRFSRFEVFEHIVLAVSFFTLVFTGFALKYSEAAWVRWLTYIGFDEALRSTVHRVCGVLLILLSVAHTGFFLGTRRGRRDLLALRPTIRDLEELVGTLAYHLGLRETRPRPPRYDYAEKAEYLALIWGTTIMILTGLVLWFPDKVTQWLPDWIVEASEIVHFYEAWLAFLAILVWHFFFVIFHPEEYPLNLTFLTGKITRRKAEERDLPPEDLVEDHEERMGPSMRIPTR